MPASVADLVKTAPQQAASSAFMPPAPKPTVKFDDVLSARRTKVEVKPADPAPKSEAKKSVSKADSKKSTDDTKKTDDTDQADHTDASDEAASEASKSNDAKPVKKTDGKRKSDDDADDTAADTDCKTDTEADPSAKPAPTQATDDTADDDLPVKADADGEKKPDNADGDKADLSPDAATLAAQLNGQPAQQPKPTDPKPAEAKAGTDDAAAAVQKAAATAKPAKAATDAKAVGEDEPVDPKAKLAIKPKDAKAADADESAEDAIQLPPDTAKPATKVATPDKDDAAAALQPIAAPQEKPAPQHSMLAAVQSQQAAPEAKRTVAEDNVDRIVTSVRGELLTKGGSMTIRLDPPTLGSINVQINVDDGVMSAQLQTTNDEATRLLSHNLSQLKTSLEAAGVTVDRIQVKQAAPADTSNSSQNNSGEGGQQKGDGGWQDQSARQEQQRREMLQRMWAKLSGSGDPLDLVA